MDVRPPALRDLALIFALSGAAGLVHEVAWSRVLGQGLGQSLQALTAVLVAFLGGLAAGAWAGGRYAGRLAAPLRAYAVLEFGIAIYGALAPDIAALLARGVEALGPGLASGAPLAGLRLTLAVIALAPLTVAMGATLPLLVREAVARGAAPEKAVAVLYGVNTVGAAFGALAGAFALLPLLGTHRTFAAAAMLNLMAGGAALILRPGAALRRAAPGGTVPPLPQAAHADPSPVVSLRLAVSVATLSGAVGALLQVGWIRMLTLSFGSSIYAVGCGLTAYLLGLGLGPLAWSIRPLLPRRTEAGRAAAAQWCVGAASIALLPGLGILPTAAARISGRIGQEPLLLIAVQFLVAAALLLLPTMAQGATFPPLTSLASLAGLPPHHAAGRIYAASTAGSVLGFLLAGFAALPTLGTRRTLVLAAAGALALSAVLILADPRRRGSRPGEAPSAGRRRAVTVAAILVPAPLLLLLLPSWDRQAISGGGYLYGPVYRAALGDRDIGEAIRRRGEIIYYREGGEALVTVRRSRAGILSLQINGKTEASSGGDMATQLLVSHLPLLAHPDPRDVLLIGLASGVSLGAAERHPIGRVLTVEIIPDVLAAARRFAADNHGALDDPRSEVVIDDARAHLLARADRYDVIASQPSNPWVAGVANLFTEDFYRLARRRLRPGGLLCQWVQAYRLDPDDLRGIVRSFLEVFPGATLWEESAGGGDYFLLGGDQAVRIDPVRLERAGAEIWDDLRRAGIDGPADLLARFVSGPAGLAAFASGARPHTDDDLYLEWRAPLALFRGTLPAPTALLSRHREPVTSVLPEDVAGRHPDLVAALGERLRRRAERLALAGSLADADRVALRDPYLAAGIEYLRGGRFPDAVRALSRAAAMNPDSATLHLLLGEAYRSAGLDDAAVVAFREAVRHDPGMAAAWNALGGYFAARGAMDRARDAFERAVRADPSAAASRNNLGAALLAEGDLSAAEEALRGALRAEPGLAAAHANLGLVLKRRGDRAGAEREYRAALALDPLNADARYNLAATLGEIGRSAEARSQLQQLLRIDPADREALKLLRGLPSPGRDDRDPEAGPARRTVR